ncbi:MAG: hypothetical protein AAGJ87_15945 [Pseudomonadota bacterium]
MMRFIAVLASMAVFAAPVVAEDALLTTERAERFAGSIVEATELGEKLKADGAGDVFDDDAEIKAGEPFRPYSGTLEGLKAEHPSAYAEVNAFAKKHQFKNAADWARAGDQTMLAYVASKVPPELAAMSAAMPAEMLAMMPAETVAEYKKSMEVMKALAAVSAADKAAIEPVMPLLDAAIAESGRRSGAFEAFDAAPSFPQ